MYTENDEDLSFISKELSLDFGTGSPSVLINIEPPVVDAELTEKLIENMADIGDSLVYQEKLVIHSGSVAARIKDCKCRTRGSSKPPVKHRLVQASSSSRDIRQKTCPPKANFPFLTISNDEEGLPDVFELQNANALVDNVVNRRAREWLKVVELLKGECKVLKEREKARDRECEELKAKCDIVMADFYNNLTVNVLHQKIVAFSNKVKEHKASLDRMLLESKKWAGY
nr:hypothetical protein [Tanacetum cinerariifolium]